MASKEVAKSAAKLMRPKAMDIVFSKWDNRLMYWNAGIFIALLAFQTPFIVNWYNRYADFFKNYDAKATYERQVKAGVFMAIRPDGTFRRWYRPREINTQYALSDEKLAERKEKHAQHCNRRSIVFANE